MDSKLKKRIFDLLWASAAAAGAAFLTTFIPGLKELLGDALSQSTTPFFAGLTILLRNI